MVSSGNELQPEVFGNQLGRFGSEKTHKPKKIRHYVVQLTGPHKLKCLPKNLLDLEKSLFDKNIMVSPEYQCRRV